MKFTKFLGDIVPILSSGISTEVSEKIRKNVEIGNICLRANEKKAIYLEASQHDILTGYKPKEVVEHSDSGKIWDQVDYGGYFENVGFIYNIRTKDQNGKYLYHTFLTQENSEAQEMLNEKRFKESISKDIYVSFIKKYKYKPVVLKDSTTIKEDGNKGFLPFKHTLQYANKVGPLGWMMNIRIDFGDKEDTIGRWYSFLITGKTNDWQKNIKEIQDGIFKLKAKSFPVKLDLVDKNGWGSVYSSSLYGQNGQDTAKFEFNAYFKINQRREKEIDELIEKNPYYKNNLVLEQFANNVRIIPILETVGENIGDITFKTKRISVVGGKSNISFSGKKQFNQNELGVGSEELNIFDHAIDLTLFVKEVVDMLDPVNWLWFLIGSAKHEEPNVQRTYYQSSSIENILEKSQIQLFDSKYQVRKDTLHVNGEVVAEARNRINGLSAGKNTIEVKDFFAEGSYDVVVAEFQKTKDWS